MRIQVTLSDKMNERVERMAEDLGLTKSATCNMLIGQGVASWEKANNMMAVMPKEVADRLVSSDN